MANLSTKYLNLELKNPLVASASVLSKKLSNIKSMEDAGIACVVLYSLFEEQINHESLELHHYLSRGTESFAEALTYFPEFDSYNSGADRYLQLIADAKSSVDIPIIGSLNGISNSGWVEYAKNIEQAGADALELNIYFLSTDSTISAEELEKSYLDLIQSVRKSIRIPVAVKLSPFFTSLPNTLLKMVNAGASGLVLFNRFYQPDLDIEKLVVEPTLHLSTSSDLLLPLRWTAILYERIAADIALTSGVHSGEDMVKALMAGAAVTMSASALIKNGVDYARTMLQELTNWMDAHDYESVENLRGSLSQKSVAFPAAFERANYMKALTKFDDQV
jgi:dihydroorotate dehydrogenase (fumarate)